MFNKPRFSAKLRGIIKQCESLGINTKGLYNVEIQADLAYPACAGRTFGMDLDEELCRALQAEIRDKLRKAEPIEFQKPRKYVHI